MDHFDVTTGVLDSWDLLDPRLDTFISRNKGVQVSSLNLFRSSTSVLLKRTSYTPVFNSISAGYYPVFGGFYKTCPPTYDKPLIHVTVSPRSQKTVNETRKRKQSKKSPLNSDHSICSKKIYIVVPGPKKNKVYAIETTNARIFKEISDNKLLSECMIKSYIKSMNKARKKNSDKAKEKGNQLKTIPECSPACAYMNMNINKEKNPSPERSGTASPRSPVRSSFKITTKVESKNSMTTTQRRTKSPDRSGQDDNAKAKSPVRLNRQKEKLVSQTDKNRKEEAKSPDRFSFISGKRSIESVIAAEKRRSPERYEKRASSSARGGRIRITGRLGLDEDDKCVLKCDATLNDEPIPTQFQGATCAMLPICFQARNEEIGSSSKQHDATVQAKERGARFLANSEISKESQATQVDFQFSYSPATNRSDRCGRGKIMQQCACVNTDENVRQMLEAKEDPDFGLKKQHSPLIVISVYSKNASSESSGDVKQKQNKSAGQKKENKTGRSRSPSPAKSPKKLGVKKSESRVNASTSKKTVRETARKEIRSKANQNQSKTLVRSTTVTKSKFENKTNKNKSSKTQKTPPQSRRSRSPEINQEEDKAELKRALIDDFTKTYTEQINHRNAHLEIPLQTKHNVSNITIDIEGDSEYYNVKLEQDVGKLNTELTVRKPEKKVREGDRIIGETDSTSMENFLYMPEEEPRKRSFSQTLMFDGTDMTMNSELEAENELNVKDSIEISHKREHRTSSVGKRERNNISIEVDSKKFAPDKHFQGDDCSISDQDARDREIRRLLGIDKGVKKCRIRPSKPCDVFDKGCQALLRSSLTTNTTTENLSNTVILTRPLCLMNCTQNIQLLYQLSLRKPIVLTLSQYAKLKRTICKKTLTKQNCSAKWYNHERFIDNRFKIVRTDNSQILHYDKDSQTDNELLDQQCATANVSDANTYIVDKINSADLRDVNSNCRDCQFSSNTEQETFENSSNANCTQQVINYNNYYSMHNVLKTVYIAREQNMPIKKIPHKKAASVKDIQYLYRKMDSRQKVRFSSSDSANYVSRGQEKKDSYSIHTIFKYYRKSVTPNLGTSAYSLCNGEPCAPRTKFFEDSVENLTPKKPFLKRLISCLVFKVSPAENKNPKAWHECGSTRSSFDSYHISTSLGAVEMSSSLYDTTASFYSNHSVPAAKTRRGFLSSVRGLLSRKH